MSVSRVYADVNTEKNKSYWNYQCFEIEFGNISNYELITRIGRGKYSDVFIGKVPTKNKKIVVKVLKPVRYGKILREVSILRNLRDGVNVISLLDVVKDNASRTVSLVFDHLDHDDIYELSQEFKIYDIKFYLNEILKALDYCHSKGIMHRDVKPQNIIINHEKRILKLIDWGLAEYYSAGTKYNVRVASRFFKSPELLYYDYSLDLWSLGCMLASFSFRIEPFFRGNDNSDQFKRHKKKAWDYFIKKNLNTVIDEHTFDLLDNLLIYDHAKRLTAQEAMKHPFFNSLYIKLSDGVDTN